MARIWIGGWRGQKERPSVEDHTGNENGNVSGALPGACIEKNVPFKMAWNIKLEK